MLENLKTRANELLERFKGGRYVHGSGCLDRAGELAFGLGSNTVIIANHPDRERKAEVLEAVRSVLEGSGVGVASEKVFRGARPNAPREDVYRMEAEILQADPAFITVVGSGSTIDAAKNPQLEMKLKAMPVPLDSSLIDEYMRSILKAAAVGDPSLIRNL